jgi:AcrR family transcriptional regulator
VARTVDPRTRPALLRAARSLFYARGLAATGVDDIAAASGLTKPTLYRHFASKEALATAYLAERHEQLQADLELWIAEVPPRDRPEAVIDWLCDWIARPSFKGCAFVRAYAELPNDRGVRSRARARKRALLATLEQACKDGGADDPAGLAEQLAVIVEGATAVAFVRGTAAGAQAAARALARAAFTAAGIGGKRRQTDAS